VASDEITRADNHEFPKIKEWRIMNRGNVRYEELLSYTKKVLGKLGYPKAQADVTAWTLVEADARGVASHGVGRLEFYESNIKSGFNFPAAEPEIVHETPLSLVVEGNHAVGSYIAQFTMARVVEKAKTAGAGFGAVRNSNHFGMAALWAEMATAQGFIGMSFCNTRICSIVTFGRDRILGTNPICFAIPSSGKVPFVLDMATTTVAHGKVEVYERLNKPMPIGWVVDEEGEDTTDTHAFQKIYREKKTGGHLFLGGAGEELGGHKGYGLGLFVDLLCAGMSMGSWSRDTFVKNGGARISQFFVPIFSGTLQRLRLMWSRSCSRCARAPKRKVKTGSISTERRKSRGGQNPWSREFHWTKGNGRCWTIMRKSSAWRSFKPSPLRKQKSHDWHELRQLMFRHSCNPWLVLRLANVGYPPVM
jgi:L-2-hydroxycarboxylate dehydrogenase (NAD+)